MGIGKALTGAAALVLTAGFIQTAAAGPLIIDGTDADDHGSYNGASNLAGWEYMQRALENLGSQVSGSASKTVRVLGLSSPGACNAATGANGSAIQCAFEHSSLVGSGWSITYDSTLSSLTGNSLSTTNTGILLIPTVGLSGSGSMSSADLATVNANAGLLQSYNAGASGGAIFAMGETGTGAFGWLSTLIPGIIVTDHSGGGIPSDITLTGAGSAAFPGLTNADLAGADPWHNSFSGNLGSLSVLGTAPLGNGTANVIIGGGTSTVITASEPGMLAVFGFGLAGLGFARRWRKRG